MKKISLIKLFFIMAIIGACANVSANTTFQYDDKGKRDPLVSLVTQEGAIITYETDFVISDLNLEGIVADRSGKNIAIINGRIVREGDSVGNFVVKEIFETSVVLMQGEKQFDLILKKEE